MDPTREISDFFGIELLVAVIVIMIATIAVILEYMYYTFDWIWNKYKQIRDARRSFSVNKTLPVPVVQEETILKMVESVECPICYGIAIPPLVLCTKGHFVCSFCRPKMLKCGACRADFTEARNFAIEHIVDTMETKCHHAACPKIVKIGEVRKHIEECAYRPLVCYHCLLARRKPVEWEHYMSHLTEVHDCLVVKLIPGKYSSITYDLLPANQLAGNFEIANMQKLWVPTILKLRTEGSTLLLNIEAEESIAFISISAFSPQDYGRYIAYLSVSKDQTLDNEQEDNFEYEVLFHVAPHHMAREEVRYSKYCAAIPLRTLQELSNQEDDGSWNFTLELGLRLP